MDFGNILIDFYTDPYEITRENWVFASSLDGLTNTFYELHYCPTKRYKQGLLIDDVWSENDDNNFSKKVDLYIVANSSLLTENFVLNDTYSYFLRCKDVHKTFITLNECPDNILQYLRRRDFKSSYNKEAIKPIISLVTTVYNNAILLEQTIQSVINQTSNSFEYIIKDANSTDNFWEVVSRYSDCDIKIISEKDRGIYEGMHQGFVASSGEYVQILNSDDLFKTKDVINKYIDEITQTHCDGYCSDIMIRFPNGKRLIRRADLSKLYYRACVNHTSLVLKKNAYFSVGGFDLSYRISADYDLTIRLVKAGYIIKHIDLVCVNFRAEGASCRQERFSDFVESLKCRYRFHPFNIRGYLYVIIRKIKYIIIK